MLWPLLPPRCSDLIKERGIPLGQWNPGSEEFALDKESAIRALETLEGSNIAVLGGDVVRILQGRLKYVYAQWSSERRNGEDSKNFAMRSRREALDFVLTFRPMEAYEPLFVFVLSAMVDAAQPPLS